MPISKRSWKFRGSLVHFLRVHASCLRVGVLRKIIAGGQVINNRPGLEIYLCTIPPWTLVDQAEEIFNLSLAGIGMTTMTRPYLGNVVRLQARYYPRQRGSCLGTRFRGDLVGLKPWHFETLGAN